MSLNLRHCAGKTNMPTLVMCLITRFMIFKNDLNVFAQIKVVQHLEFERVRNRVERNSNSMNDGCCKFSTLV